MYAVFSVEPLPEFDRFRTWLGHKLRRNRKLGAWLAAQLGHHRNWATRAPQGANVTFRDVCRTCRLLNTTLADVLKHQEEPGYETLRLPAATADALHDPVIVAAVEALHRIDDKAYVRETVAQLRGVARLPALPRSSESSAETPRATSTKRTPNRRR